MNKQHSEIKKEVLEIIVRFGRLYPNTFDVLDGEVMTNKLNYLESAGLIQIEYYPKYILTEAGFRIYSEIMGNFSSHYDSKIKPFI